MSFRNVHYYDGLLEDKFESKSYNQVEKKALFENLKPKLKEQDAIAMVELIIEGGNDDRSNNILACDVLAEICTHLTDDMVPFLEEQLIDNYRLGRCPQGRVWRLLQIYRAIQPLQEEEQQQKKVKEERDYLETLLKNRSKKAKKVYIGRFFAHPEKRDELYKELIEKKQ